MYVVGHAHAHWDTTSDTPESHPREKPAAACLTRGSFLLSIIEGDPRGGRVVHTENTARPRRKLRALTSDGAIQGICLYYL